ncbi:S8 family serine peptidase [Nocardiopsis sp. LOL_012]|uniref:S8 family serine peptidase n=1 Tax=Nocardiopsis sp. LOL_012 TaxID=3345409 RepID=UPI003A85ECCD
MLGGNSRNTTRKRRLGTVGAVTATVLLGTAAVPSVAAGQPDFRPEQWGLLSIGVEEAWGETYGRGTTVALPGAAVPEDHPDLVDNVTVDTAYGPNEGDLDQGTAVAALVASHGHGMDADGGMLGVAPKAGVLALPTADLLPDAVRGAADEGVQVILLPEAAQASDADLSAATEEAVSGGSLVVGPAGGDDPSVLSVAGADENGALIPGSPDTADIELTAPGAALAATSPDGSPAQVTGAPYAAAMVAGAAALLLTQYPQLSPDQARQALVEGSQPGPEGTPALHLPSAAGAAAEITQGAPLIDEELLERSQEGPGVPLWAWFAAVGAVLLLGVLLVAVWVRRSSADPYGVREDRRHEDEEIAAERAAEKEAERPTKGGRRRKPRNGKG